MGLPSAQSNECSEMFFVVMTCAVHDEFMEVFSLRTELM